VIFGFGIWWGAQKEKKEKIWPIITEIGVF